MKKNSLIKAIKNTCKTNEIPDKPLKNYEVFYSVKDFCERFITSADSFKLTQDSISFFIKGELNACVRDWKTFQEITEYEEEIS